MKVIAAPSGGGKTDEAIRLSAETGDVLVVASLRLADQAERRARMLGLKIKRPMSVDQLLSGSNRGYRGPFILDGVEIALGRVFPTLDFSAITVDQG